MSLTGPTTKACSVYLSAAALSNTPVNLSSSNAAVKVPATVTVAVGRLTAGFSATVSAVSTTQTATLTGTSGGISQTLSLSVLPATTAGLGVSATNLGFGSIAVSTVVSQSLTLTSTGTAPLTISAATLSGSGFTASGVTLPVTLNPGQAATLTVSFKPVAAGSAGGTLTIANNSKATPAATIAISGTGVAVVSALACGVNSMVGPGSASCTVTLNAAAPAGGQSVSLSSNNAAAAVPSSLTIPAGVSSAAFAATVSSVTSTQVATLTASANGVSKSFALQDQAAIPTLGISATSVAFGSVTLNTPVTSSLTLTSTGTAPVTVSAAAISGTGFSITGAKCPVTLNPGQSATLTLQFDPTTPGASTGQMTITSNSSTGNSTMVSLSGTGSPATTGMTYYLAPRANGGSDFNSGLSLNEPWLSPDHSLNCGDVIIAAPSTAYDSDKMGIYLTQVPTTSCGFRTAALPNI